MASAAIILGFNATVISAQQTSVADGKGVNPETRVGDVLARPVTVSLDAVDAKTAILAIGRSARVRVQVASELIEAITRPITLHVKQQPISVVLERVLDGTSLHIVALDRDVIQIEQAMEVSRKSQGVITGIVTDARTGKPVLGAKIVVDGTTKAETSDRGTYRVLVEPGTHLVMVRMLGYNKVSRTVTVNDGATETMSVALEVSVSPLDQVVVTGTVIGTELRAVPNAITIITAKEIEQRGITHIDQLFRGSVPGVFAQNSGNPYRPIRMWVRGSTTLDGSPSQPIKTIVDGVEMANSDYLNQIDPASIERIEILTGPQASTIYGSNAINGVMQIFTKRGAQHRPQLSATIKSGFVQNGVNTRLTPQHDISVQGNGTDGNISYNVGSGLIYLGQWDLSGQTTKTSGFGGLRYQEGPITMDGTIRLTKDVITTGGETDYRLLDRGAGYFAPAVTRGGLPSQGKGTQNSQTLGITLGYHPTGWWSNELSIGRDAANDDYVDNRPIFRSVADTLLQLSGNDYSQTSIRYNSAVRASFTKDVQASLTFGVDHYENLYANYSISPPVLSGTLISDSYLITRQPTHNSGMFFQGQLGVLDEIFLTYGIRAEWNPNYGADVTPNTEPRYGIAFTHSLGELTAKIRASYGHSTRPPTVNLIQDVPLSIANPGDVLNHGDVVKTFGNPNLLPEQQQGGEGGLELYFGTRSSLIITRYNQTVDNLIVSAVVDSVDLLPARKVEEGIGDWDPSWILYQTQNLNLGSVRNQGWEVQGTINAGPIETKGVYSWTKSRILGVAPQYQAQFPQYVRGSTFNLLPEHTWSLSSAYADGGSRLALTISGVGITNNYYYASAITRNARLQADWLRMSFPHSLSPTSGYATLDLDGSRQFTRSVQGTISVKNLTNYYHDDSEAGYHGVLGRQTLCGIRVIW